MAEKSDVSWCDSTFNGWIGCTKASPGCQHCYAENLMADRWNRVEWGPSAPRLRTSESNWKEPRRWNDKLFCVCPNCGWRGNYPKNRACTNCNRIMPSRVPARRRVFAHSLSDVFEKRSDLFEWQKEEIKLWEETPRLDWIVLTKHPDKMLALMPTLGYPMNVATGTSVENQEWAEKRIPFLLKVQSTTKFLSVEPMLGPLDLSPWISKLDWVICGAESGKDRRPFDIEAAIDLYYQCQKAGVKFFMKQGSDFKPGQQAGIPDYLWEVKQFPDFALKEAHNLNFIMNGGL